MKSIEKGELRIGRRILMEELGGEGAGRLMILWHHARCMFNVFARARKNTRVLESPDDLDGFAELQPKDQEMLRELISKLCISRGTTMKREKKKGIPGGDGGGGKTPKNKRPLITLDDNTEIKKKAKGPVDFRKEGHVPKKGDVVWTFCKVKPEELPGAAPLPSFSMKSPKAELGQIVEEARNGSMIIQFEKANDEKARLDKREMRYAKKIMGWLRYPRSFDGKKQRIPLNWVQFDRPPPRLCSCDKQSWGHSCMPVCGLSCGRGTSSKVFGVDRP